MGQTKKILANIGMFAEMLCSFCGEIRQFRGKILYGYGNPALAKGERPYKLPVVNCSSALGLLTSYYICHTTVIFIDVDNAKEGWEGGFQDGRINLT